MFRALRCPFCYNLHPGHYSILPAPSFQPTATQERDDHCGNQHYSRALLMMGIVVPETCWAYTYSMVQSPSWEANWFAASQEIPRISRNPNVHYRTHKGPPLVSILGQPNPVHIPTSHLLEIRSNIIHPSTPRSPQWSPSIRFPHQEPIHPLSSPIRATCPTHLILCWAYKKYNKIISSI